MKMRILFLRLVYSVLWPVGDIFYCFGESASSMGLNFIVVGR